MSKHITSEIIIAYTQCPRKAFLLLCTDTKGTFPEYSQILKQRYQANREQYLKNLCDDNFINTAPYSLDFLKHPCEVVLNATLTHDNLEADCACLSKVEGRLTGGKFHYEPTICTGTYTITKEQKLRLLYVGYVLKQLQRNSPIVGRIVTVDGKLHKVKLNALDKTIQQLLEPLQQWMLTPPLEPPSLVLNKHCLVCQYQTLCKFEADQNDNLSLLNKVTSKIIAKYEKKGIFTVKQLSYVFKPRKPKKRSKHHITTHNIELQALAIRKQKIFLQELPAITRQPVEIFLDIEGIPDQQFYYLIGLLICKNGNISTQYSFWSDTPHDEHVMWQRFLETIQSYNDAPIFHYGSYEPKAMTKLAKRYNADIASLEERLINVLTFIHSKIYFPVYSNSLKEIGRCLGATWTAPNASGLQSLVWRYRWEQTTQPHYKTCLLKYNAEDCHAVKILVEKLSNISDSATTLNDVDFADKRKQQMTQIGQEIHEQFMIIRNLSYADHEMRKISFRQKVTKQESDQKRKEKIKFAARKSQQKRKEARQRVRKIVHVSNGEVCPECGHKPLQATENVAKRTIVDIVLTRSGIKKTLIQYVGFQGYCEHCKRYYSPPDISKYGRLQLYGHGFKAWVIYQRVALRLPYSSIRETIKEYFNLQISMSRLPDFIQDLGHYYEQTEKDIVVHLLASPFIHADETPVSIQGVNQYVWVFTDGKHVLFRLTETREPTIVHELLADYTGVLISDFYPGYDSVPCRQQKCWGHLIRDLNDELLENPFDSEFETFAWEVKNLIVPIMKAVQKYGLKTYHLRKFQKSVDRFYVNTITEQRYKSDLVTKYQKRFVRYRDSLFTFLEIDDIAWHNNTAERAIRHVAKQRSISRSFHTSVMENYLILLGIKQACRFQEKSFFKFLLSGEIHLDQFGKRKFSPQNQLGGRII